MILLAPAVHPRRLLNRSRRNHHPHAPMSGDKCHNVTMSQYPNVWGQVSQAQRGPIWHLCPVMAPPRASTRKLTRKPALLEGKVPWVGLIIGVGYSGILQDHFVSELLQIFLEWLEEWWARKKTRKKRKKK